MLAGLPCFKVVREGSEPLILYYTHVPYCLPTSQLQVASLRKDLLLASAPYCIGLLKLIEFHVFTI